MQIELRLRRDTHNAWLIRQANYGLAICGCQPIDSRYCRDCEFTDPCGSRLIASLNIDDVDEVALHQALWQLWQAREIMTAEESMLRALEACGSASQEAGESLERGGLQLQLSWSAASPMS